MSSEERDEPSTASGSEIEVFVFPLEGVVFFPSTSMPLNIFEPRYLKMVRDSIETRTPIALTAIDPSRVGDLESPTHPVIAGMGLPVILEKKPDGTLLILLTGVGKVRIQQVLSERPYTIAQAVVLAEESSLSSELDSDYERLRKLLVNALRENMGEESEADREKVEEAFQDSKKVLEYLAMFKLSDSALKQQILEMERLDDKLKVMKYVL